MECINVTIKRMFSECYFVMKTFLKCGCDVILFNFLLAIKLNVLYLK